jgi:hypothetical protein
MRKNVAIAFLLGLLIATYGSMLLRAPQAPVQADAIHDGGYVGVAGNAQPGAKDIMWLVDTHGDSPHLVCYQLDQGRLMIAAARNIRYDFMLDQWPINGAPQDPTVQAVFKIAVDSGKVAKGGGTGGGASNSPPSGATTGGATGSTGH